MHYNGLFNCCGFDLQCSRNYLACMVGVQVTTAQGFGVAHTIGDTRGEKFVRLRALSSRVCYTKFTRLSKNLRSLLFYRLDCTGSCGRDE